MNRFISFTFLTLFIFITSWAAAQKVDSTNIDGKKVYIYPFKQAVHAHTMYFNVINSNDMIKFTYKHFKKEIKESYRGEEIDEKQLKKIFKEFRRKSRGTTSKYERKGKFKRNARKNPYPLLEPRYSYDVDLTPVLDPIPDGDYIMYFEPFCLTDSKGNCQEDAERIAARFHMKNNLLEGEAVWLNMQGDTLKKGSYVNGLKEGVWYLEKRALDYYASNTAAKEYIEFGHPIVDTTWMRIEYVHGAQEGYFEKYNSSEYPVETGYYLEGEMSGEWTLRNILYDGPKWKQVRTRTNNIVTSHYTLAGSEDTIVVKQPWIRDRLVSTYGYDMMEFNFNPKYRLRGPREDLFEMNFAKEEDLELEEEKFMSHNMYEGEEYMMDEYGYEGDYYYDYGYSSEIAKVYDKDLKISRPRGDIIDSIGMIANYKGVYEEHYPNGQLAYKYEFVDGKLLAEDTIFWDNGKAHDVITFDADSNHYLRRIYDYKGKLYQSRVYDSLGNFDRYEFEIDETEYVYLDGLKAVVDDYGDFITYNVVDTLENELSSPLYLKKTWFKDDSSKIFTTHYDPIERVLTEINYSATGTKPKRAYLTFSEEFDNWNGKDTVVYDDLMIITTSSASLYENDFVEPDTIPQRNVEKAWYQFDVTEDQELFRAGDLYTGKVSIQSNKGYSIKVSSSGMNISLPKFNYKMEKKLSKKLDALREKGKHTNDPLFSYIDYSDYKNDIGNYFFNHFFHSLLSEQFSLGSDEYYWFGYSEDAIQFSKIEGSMLDGKPVGEWIAYDESGKVKKVVPFDKGEISGTVKNYSYEYPPSKEEDYYWDYEPDFGDSLPKKKTYYLSSEMEYKNGERDGKTIYYNWLGEKLSEENFKEGYRHGPAFERNNLAITKMGYSDGALDGYVQTYLTLPEKDSILLYDLNFQNGNLQGESKAYHVNGNLAKRGFFLNGEPIDDYEAYDTLGFKYHYVKFQYGFPIEEKIWEENELSVRYLFDWQDSIYFEPSDITTSQSLESMLVDLGFGNQWLDAPYYGRPSLVNKNDVIYHMTKYYPNDTIARDGDLDDGMKVGCWKFYDYEGMKLYEVEYFDSIIEINDSIKFKSKGVYTKVDADGKPLYEAYIIEKFEKYDCSHSDHYEIRQFMTTWEAEDSLNRMNGFVKNYYDNGTLQSEGEMKDGLPTGVWRIYDPFGKLNQYGEYFMGKRNGRWLAGDLSKTKYLGDICLNPNMPDLEKEIEYRENLLDIDITTYKLGKAVGRQYYDINMNRFKDVEEDEAVEIEEMEE